jgi:hypothetical protein
MTEAPGALFAARAGLGGGPLAAFREATPTRKKSSTLKISAVRRGSMRPSFLLEDYYEAVICGLLCPLPVACRLSPD